MAQKQRPRFGPLQRIYAILVIDGIIGSIVIPAFPRFTEKTAHPELWFGIATTLFALMQFLAAPALGMYSDAYGRRPVFRLAAIGTFFAMLLSLPVRLVPFLGNRVIDGTTNGLYAVVKSAIADISPPEDTQRNIGFTATLSYAGFIIGPGVSLGVLWIAKLLDIENVRALIVAGLVFASINIALSLGVRETAVPSSQTMSLTTTMREASPLRIVRRVVALLADNPRLGRLIVLEGSLMFSLGYYSYFSIFVARSKIGLDERGIATLFFYFATLGIVTNTVFFTRLLPRMDGDRWLRLLVGFGVPVLVMYGLSGGSIALLYVTLTLDMLTYALLPGLIEGLIGLSVDPDRKGEVFGLVQGTGALVGVAATATYTALSVIDLRFPFFLFAAVAVVTTFLVYRLPPPANARMAPDLSA